MPVGLQPVLQNFLQYAAAVVLVVEALFAGLFDFPEGRVRGFYVTGCKGFRLTRQDIFIPLKSVVRIGEDVILTEADDIPPPKKPCRKPRRDCCQPDFSQNCDDRNCAPKDRRSYDEYE